MVAWCSMWILSTQRRHECRGSGLNPWNDAMSLEADCLWRCPCCVSRANFPYLSVVSVVLTTNKTQVSGRPKVSRPSWWFVRTGQILGGAPPMKAAKYQIVWGAQDFDFTGRPGRHRSMRWAGNRLEKKAMICLGKNPLYISVISGMRFLIGWSCNDCHDARWRSSPSWFLAVPLLLCASFVSTSGTVAAAAVYHFYNQRSRNGDVWIIEDVGRYEANLTNHLHSWPTKSQLNLLKLYKHLLNALWRHW